MSGRSRAHVILGLAVVPLLASLHATRAGATETRPGSGRLTLEYNRDLSGGDKQRAIASTTAVLADLGIRVEVGAPDVQAVVGASGGKVSASAVTDPHLLYDAVHYLTDLARLPPSTHSLFSRIVVVRELRAEDARTGRKRAVPIAYVPEARAIAVDHENLNQLEFFGAFVHPKVNYAMLLQVALEARLKERGTDALRELGLDLVVDDDEWVRLNGRGDGWAAYNGEDVTFVGLKTAARVTPPGMLYDALRELRTGVPATAYEGMPEASQPWWSPRHSPGIERQNILRCMFGLSPEFFDRLGGRNGIRQDRILQEKTRLILYAAFVASGGVLDHGFWTRRHPAHAEVEALTRDFVNAPVGGLSR